MVEAAILIILRLIIGFIGGYAVMGCINIIRRFI